MRLDSCIKFETYLLAVLQGVARTILTRMMGPAMNNCHAILPPALELSKFWTVDDPTSAHRYLRPSWDTWAPNTGVWLAEAVEKARQDGHQFYPASLDDIRAIPLVDLEIAFETAWTSMCVKVQLSQKDEETRAATAKRNRHAGRKVGVSHLLSSVLVNDSMTDVRLTESQGSRGRSLAGCKA